MGLKVTLFTVQLHHSMDMSLAFFHWNQPENRKTSDAPLGKTRRAPAHRGRWRFSQLQHGLHPTELDRIREVPHLWGLGAGAYWGAERAESGGPGSEAGWVLIELGRKLSCNWSLFQIVPGYQLVAYLQIFFWFPSELLHFGWNETRGPVVKMVNHHQWTIHMEIKAKTYNDWLVVGNIFHFP